MSHRWLVLALFLVLKLALFPFEFEDFVEHTRRPATKVHSAFLPPNSASACVHTSKGLALDRASGSATNTLLSERRIKTRAIIARCVCSSRLLLNALDRITENMRRRRRCSAEMGRYLRGVICASLLWKGGGERKGRFFPGAPLPVGKRSPLLH